MRPLTRSWLLCVRRGAARACVGHEAQCPGPTCEHADASSGGPHAGAHELERAKRLPCAATLAKPRRISRPGVNTGAAQQAVRMARRSHAPSVDAPAAHA